MTFGINYLRTSFSRNQIFDIPFFISTNYQVAIDSLGNIAFLNIYNKYEFYGTSAVKVLPVQSYYQLL